MLWVKSFHIVFMVSWFAGLFYLPRLFVYHSMSPHPEVRAQLKIMERKLLGITHVAAILNLCFATALLWLVPGFLSQGWLHAKLGLVLLLFGYHLWCWRLVRQLASDEIPHGHVWFRWFNEAPVFLLIAIVLLVELKPF